MTRMMSRGSGTRAFEFKPETTAAMAAREAATLPRAPKRAPGRDVLVVRDGVVTGINYDCSGDPAEGELYLSPAVYSEAEIRQPLPWPRAWRGRLLAETDFWELPSVRAAAGSVRNEARDAWRAALRDLPETCPDPWDVTLPERPE